MSEFIFRYRPWNMESEEGADYLAGLMEAFEDAFAEYEAQSSTVEGDLSSTVEVEH